MPPKRPGRREHLAFIGLASEELAKALERQKHSPKNIALVREALELTIRGNREPQGLLTPLVALVERKRTTGPHLSILLPQLIETLKAGNDSRDLAHALRWALQTNSVAERELPSLAPLLRETLEEAKRAGFEPSLLAGKLGDGFQNGALNGRRLAPILRELIGTAKEGNDPYPLAHVLATGLASGAIRDRQLPRVMPLVRNHLAWTKRNWGQNPQNLAHVLAAGLESKALTGAQLPSVTPLLRETLEEADAAGHPPHELASALIEGLRAKAVTGRDLPELLEHAARGWRPRPRMTVRGFLWRLADFPRLLWNSVRGKRERRWGPHDYVTHAVQANKEIQSLPETLRIQEQLLERGRQPTRELTLKHWKRRKG